MRSGMVSKGTLCYSLRVYGTLGFTSDDLGLIILIWDPISPR
jgi:hypothetical protein